MSSTTRHNPFQVLTALLVGASIVTGGLAVAQELTDGPAGRTTTNPSGDAETVLPDSAGADDMVSRLVDTAGSAESLASVDVDDAVPAAVTAAALVAEHGPGLVELETPLLLEGAAPVAIDAPGLGITLAADGTIAAVEPGPGSLPLPSFGALTDAVAAEFAGTVGYASGTEIAHLGGHTRADTNYWYVVLSSSTQLDTGLPFIDQLPVSFSLPGQGSSVVLFDPLDPYLYVSFPCPSAGASGPETERSPADRSGDRDDQTITASISTYPSSGCGVGFSGGGRIPFTASTSAGIPDAFASLEAELVLDGEFPVSTAANVTGSAYVDFEGDGFALAADGELSVGFAIAPGQLDLTLPIGRGSLAYEYRGTHEDLWFAGTTGTHLLDGGGIDLLVDLAPTQGELTLSGRLRHEGTADGGSVIGAESFLQLEGSAQLGLSTFAELAGVELQPLADVALLARVDTAGVALQATSAHSPIPGIEVAGDAEIDLLLPFADLSNSFVQIDGALSVGGVDLDAGATVRIDRDGALVAGHLTTPAGGFDLEGRVGPNGVQLTGRAEIVLAVPDLHAYAEQLAREAGVQGTIDAIERRIDERIAEIAAVDPSRATLLRDTITAFRHERANVASIQQNIDINNGEIARVTALLADADRLWQSYTTGEQLLHSIPHGAYVAALNLEREGYKGANTLQRGYMATANLALTGLEQALVGLIGVDDELWRLEGMASELRLHAFSAEFLSILAEGAGDLLDTFGVTGELRGTVELSLGTEGLDGALDVSHCRDGQCTTLVGGTVTFPDFEACVTVLGLEACARF